MDELDELDKLVNKRRKIYDTRLGPDMRDDTILMVELTDGEYRGFIVLLSWTVNQVSDGVFSREHTAMLPHVTDERMNRYIELGLVEVYGDKLRIGHQYQSWQSSREELKRQAKKRQDGNERQKKHRENKKADEAAAAASTDVPAGTSADRAMELVNTVQRGPLAAVVKAKLAEQVSILLNDGFSEEQITRALDTWQDGDNSPGYLPYLVKAGSEEGSGVRAAIKQARDTGDASPLREFGYRYQKPDSPDGAKSANEIRAHQTSHLNEWLDGIEAKQA